MGALLTLALAAGLVQVEGPACPGPEAVSRHLEALLPAGFAAAGFADGGSRARLRREGERLRVQLLDEAGRLLLSRELAAGGDCEALAAAAAVVLAAAWIAPDRAPQAADSAPIEFAPHPRPPPPPPPLPVDFAAGVVASFTGSRAAAGGSLEAALAPPGHRLGIRLAFTGSDMRDEPLGPGRVAYTRLAFALGPRYRLSRGRLFADLHAEGLLAAVLVQGSGYAENSSGSDIDLGIGGGIRVALRLAQGRVAPFLGLAIAGWLRPQQVQVIGVDGTLTLPQVEVLLSAGVAVGRFP